jgi:NitT/TauT family transport system substrate-binding protein
MTWSFKCFAASALRNTQLTEMAPIHKKLAIVTASLLLQMLLSLQPIFAESPRIYKVGMDPWIGCSPLNVAEVERFWDNRGIRVKVIVFRGSTESTNALVNKDIDFCYEMVGTWISKLVDAQAPIRVLGECVWSNGGDKIIFKRGVDIKDLRGEPIGIYSPDLAVSLFLNAYLEQNKLSYTDFDIVPLKDEDLLADSFISGRFQAIVHYDPFALRAIREGEGEVAATTADFPGCMPEGFAARADVLEKIPHGDVVKFFQGWIDAVNWCHDPHNWSNYEKILNEQTFKGQNNSESDLREMVQAVKIHNSSELLLRNAPDGPLDKFVENAALFLQTTRHQNLGVSPKEFLKTDALLEAAGPASISSTRK